MTIGADFVIKELTFQDGTKIALQIWDIAGQPHFEFVRASFYKGSHAIIMVFDLTSPQTLYHLEKWKNEIMAIINWVIPFLVVGNKIDLQSTIDHEDVKDFIENFKHKTQLKSLPLLFTSALTGHKIKEVFEALGRSILEQDNTSSKSPDYSIIMNNS